MKNKNTQTSSVLRLDINPSSTDCSGDTSHYEAAALSGWSLMWLMNSRVRAQLEEKIFLSALTGEKIVWLGNVPVVFATVVKIYRSAENLEKSENLLTFF